MQSSYCRKYCLIIYLLIGKECTHNTCKFHYKSNYSYLNESHPVVFVPK